MIKNLGNLLSIALGWLCVVLGVIGIFLPLLPTTPFILLAAWLFARSSPRFHDWLMAHPRLGPIVRAWQNGEGITRGLRNRTLITLWVCLVISMLIIGKWWSVALLASIGTCSSIYICRQPIIDAYPMSSLVKDNPSE